MKFKALRISDWKQFQNIDFHERLTILTVLEKQLYYIISVH